METNLVISYFHWYENVSVPFNTEWIFFSTKYILVFFKKCCGNQVKNLFIVCHIQYQAHGNFLKSDTQIKMHCKYWSSLCKLSLN